MKVYVARWYNYERASDGTLGVYTTHERADEELKRCAPGSDHDVEPFELDATGILVDEDGFAVANA